jgi:two-component system, chemotaxis family, sensor kinase CheA
MKVSYKITLPLVLVITLMIWFVTQRFNSTQAKIVQESQEKSALEITKQFEKNKMKTLYDLEKNVKVTSDMIVEISVDDVWNFTFDNLKQPLTKYLELEYIKGIEIYEDINTKPSIVVGVISKEFKVNQKEILRNNKEPIGYAKIYYDNRYIGEYFQSSKQQLLKRIETSNQEQDTFIKELIKQSTYMNLSITFIVLLLLLLTVYFTVIRPLKRLKQGLDSFFNYLQHKSDNVQKIELSSNDEFGNMAKALNENIAVTTKLHEEIYELNVNLEEKIEERTKELQKTKDQVFQLLDNAEEGFLSFSSDGVIDKEYSKKCVEIFGSLIDNKNIIDLLFNKKEDQELFSKVIKDLFSPKLKPKRKKVLLQLLPKEIYINDNFVKVEYKQISDEKMMLILVDITEKKNLEKKVELEKQRLKMVVSVVSNIEEFVEMVHEYKEFCSQKENYLQNEKTYVNSLVEFYRTIHTFKGNFAQKDLICIVPKLHQYESKINTLLKDPERSFNTFKTLLESEDISLWVDEDINVINEILGQDILKGNNTIHVSESLISKVEKDIEEILNFPKDARTITYEDLFEDVFKMRKKPLAELLSSYPKYVEKLAKRLEKNIYPVKIVGGEEIYVSEAIQPFIKTLVHVFRNSLDHGIELAQERIENKKDEKATITCDIEEIKEDLVINIMDDGKGIDLDIIKEKALQKKIYSVEEISNMSRNEVLMIIFSDTFSTKDQVTQLSGRGVGLGAIKGEIEKLGGSITIDTTLEKGTTFRFTIPLKAVI